jgi:geranylgeranyl pyrophosphate synthase
MPIDDSLQAVDDLLLSLTDSSVSLLRDTSQHILGAGGKRLRPRLVLLAYSAAGGRRPEDVVPLAAAVEIIHTATLVHDDINDHGTLRRGRETVNSRWGGTFALLTGDYLFTKAYQLMLPYGNELNAILAHAAVELVEGETLQIQTSKLGTLDPETYFEIIAKKTASLFVACTGLGATVARAPGAWLDALSSYAFNLGMAFQIVDDLLDLIADAKQIGKNSGIDVSQGRGIAVALQHSANGRHRAKAAAAELGTEIATVPFLSEEEVLHEAILKGREKAAEFSGLASSSLDVLPPSPAVDELRLLVQQVIERSH